jgi:hypothetical protein
MTATNTASNAALINTTLSFDILTTLAEAMTVADTACQCSNILFVEFNIFITVF